MERIARQLLNALLRFLVLRLQAIKAGLQLDDSDWVRSLTVSVSRSVKATTLAGSPFLSPGRRIPFLFWVLQVAPSLFRLCDYVDLGFIVPI